MQQKYQIMNESKTVAKAFILGILASAFLSSSFIVNSVLAHTGSNWAWTASLRYLLFIPLLLSYLASKKRLTPLLSAMKQWPFIWIVWGGLGFGVFYSCLSYAALFAPGWLVAATFQITILAGLITSPLIYNDHRATIPKKTFSISLIIVAGIMIMQFDKFQSLPDLKQLLISFFLTIAAAFLWPLGNRMLLVELEKRDIKLDTFERILGMGLGSLPVLIGLSFIGYVETGLPGNTQIISSLIAAIASGIIGGFLFFKATHLVRNNPVAFAAVESTQSGAIIFTLLGEVLIIHSPWPGFYGTVGMLIIFSGLGSQFVSSIKQAVSVIKA